MIRPCSPVRLFAVIAALVGLTACVDDFPAIAPPGQTPVDAQPQNDADSTDASPPLPDAMPPPDADVVTDRGVIDMAPDVFIEPGVCRLGVPEDSLTLRTWDGTGATRVLDLETDCDDIQFAHPPWLRVSLEGRRLRIETDAARGVTDGVVALTADERTVNIDVRRIGIEEGGDDRRALIYVVDGLKGETIAQSAPEAIEWLAKVGTKSYDAVPHAPVEGATRATGWASLLTGLARATHGYDGQGVINVPTFADRLDGRVHTAVEWDVIAAGLSAPALARRDVIERTVSALDSDASLFIVGVNGLIGADPNQLEARRAQIDADLDALLAGIARQPADQDWLIILTAATSGGEGPPDLPVLHAAPALAPRMPENVTLMDVHTSVLGWLGVMRPGWDLPGAQIEGGVEVDCGDGIDNDEDGRVDCRDEDCSDLCPACADEDISARTGRNVVNRSMVGASNERAGCTGGAAARDLVVSWVAPRSSTYMLSTDGSNFDTMLDPLRQHCAGDRLGDPNQCIDVPVGACRLDDPRECHDDPYQVDGGEPAAFVGTFSEGDLTQIFLTSFGDQDDADIAKLHIIDIVAACEAAPLLDAEFRGDNVDRLLTLPPFPRDGRFDDSCSRATSNVLLRWRPPIGNWRVALEADFEGASLGIWQGGCDALSPRFCETDALQLEVRANSEFVLVVSSSWTAQQIRQGTFRVIVTPNE